MADIRQTESKTQLRLKILGAGLLLFMLLAALSPQALWGLNSLRFLPVGLMLLLSLLSIGGIAFGDRLLNLIPKGNGEKRPWLLLRIGLGVFLGALTFVLPMALDTYGDSNYIRPDIDLVTPEWNPVILDGLFNFDLLDPKIGEKTFYSLLNLMNYLTGWKGTETLLLLNSICLGLFVFISTGLVDLKINSPKLKAGLYALIGLAPFTLLFYGHYEIYAPAFVIHMLFLWMAVVFFLHPNWVRTTLVVFCWILTIKFHITGVLYFPIVGMVFWQVIKGQKVRLKSRRVHFVFLLIAALAGAYIYFVRTESFNGGRFFSEETIFDVAFLPVVSAEPAPLDRYNLFSISHILDFFNLIFLWSPALVAGFCGVFLFFRKNIPFGSPEIIAFSLSSISMVGFFFVLNPLLSLPIDWDLFAFPALVLFAFLVAMLGEISSESPVSTLGGVMVALALAGFSWHLVHAAPDSLSTKLKNTGLWVHKTYYLGASTSLLHSMDLVSDPVEKEAAFQEITVGMEKVAIRGLDNELAEIYRIKGNEYFEAKDYAKALELFEEAAVWGPNFTSNNYKRFISRFMLQRYDSALEMVPILIADKYPSQAKALKMGIHTALEAGNYARAKVYSQNFLGLFPEDEFIGRISADLDTLEDKSTIKFRFRQK